MDYVFPDSKPTLAQRWQANETDVGPSLVQCWYDDDG